MPARLPARLPIPFAAIAAAIAVALAAPIAAAEIRVSFEESAPKDRFVIANRSGCALEALRIEIDLSTAPAGLIFDTTGSGAGVSVFQPFDLVEGTVASVSRVTDGDSRIVLDLPGLPPGGRVSFTIDVDDTVAAGPLGPTMIDGAEIAGARASATLPGGVPVSGVFGADAVAVVPLEACIS